MTSLEGRTILKDGSNPSVTVVMPCLNEENSIGKAIASLVDGFFIERAELLIIDGGSTDKTLDEIAPFIARGLSIRILHNPDRLQSYAMNLGIREARGSVIARADAHCIYPAGYLRSCLELLEKERVQNAGGTFYPVGEMSLQRDIAFAMRHPLGAGGCKFKKDDYRGFAEGAYAGMFPKEVFATIGDFDPKAHPNEDSELNIRILASGGKIFVDSAIKVVYRPRKTIRALARQFFHYGAGRCYTTLKHRRFTSLRQLVPVLLLPLILLSFLLALWNVSFIILPLAYLLCVLGSALSYGYGETVGFGSRLAIAACLVVMHLSWGAGFLKRLVSVKP